MKMLVAYSMVSTHVQTTRDYLEAAARYSGFETSFLHVTLAARMAPDVLEPYDVLFHNYCSRLIFDGFVSPGYLDAVRRFKGLKILAVQDEYDTTDKLKAAIRDLGFHVVLTCVPKSEVEKVYPAAEFPGVTFMSVLTGYVSDAFAAQAPKLVPLRQRSIPLGYRGRDIGPIYGRLGRDKFEIGLRMRQECADAKFACDIAMDEKSRIYGTAWLEFIGNCRAMLGTESGSNVFDFDGSIREKFQSLSTSLGRTPTYEEFEVFTAAKDREISMGQISPRVFECALMRTPMVLLRGRYSDAIEADVHYIPLEKDYSNARDVLRKLEDFDALEAMAERTYKHLVGSGRFGYRQFWTGLAEQLLQTRNDVRAVASTAAREASAVTEDVDRSHPLFEVVTAAPKTPDDYKRQAAAADQLDLGSVASASFNTLLRRLSRRRRLGIGLALKRALDAKKVGERQTASGRVLLLAWKVTPPQIKSRLEVTLGQIEYVQRQ